MRNADGKWVVHLAGGHDVPVWTGDDILTAVERGEIRDAFARGPDGAFAKGMPFAMASEGVRIKTRAPGLGDHNAEVLQELLGLDDAQIAALAKAGVIGTVPKA